MHVEAVDLAPIVQVLSLGVSRKQVPKLFPVFARLFGITLPGREIKVPGPMVEGKRTHVWRFVYHTPGATHCKARTRTRPPARARSPR